MTKALRAYGGKFAIWEKPASGDAMAPFNDPTEHMAEVYFHSDLQYLAKLLEDASVTINHTSLAGVTGSGISGAPASGGSTSGSSQPISDGDIRATDWTLYTHNLGYVPLYMVMYGQEIVSGATLVQEESNWRRRIVSSFATTSIIGLREMAFSSDDTLSAASRNYRVLVFRDPAPDPAKGLLKLSPAEVYFGQGKVDSGDALIRRVRVGDTQTFYLPVTETVDVWNGAVRAVSPAGAVNVAGNYSGGLFDLSFIEVAY